MESLHSAGRWIAFAVAAIAMSWLLRFIAARGAAAGRRKLGDARASVGLEREVPARFQKRNES